MNYNKKTIEDVSVSGKRVLVRCDFNVPLKDGVITDAKRINEALPTIKYLSANGAKIVLCSHLGRPKGKVNLEFTLKPVADYIEKALGKKITFISDVLADETANQVAALPNGEIILLENLRFYKEEEANDKDFSKALANLCDIYVNDAFGTAHRAHSSTAGVTEFVDISVCGYLIQKELKNLGDALDNPVRPFAALLGGAKVSDKIGVIRSLISKADTIIIGGAMANTFVKALGGELGASRIEEDKLDLALSLVNEAKEKGVSFVLPVDFLATTEFSNDAPSIVCDAYNVPAGYMALDIGPKTIEIFTEAIKNSKTVVWNGPSGVFEFSNFAKGTIAMADAIAKYAEVSVIGGGDSAAAVEQFGYADKVTHISTGGGASLEFLEGLSLPGIACLCDK